VLISIPAPVRCLSVNSKWPLSRVAQSVTLLICVQEIRSRLFGFPGFCNCPLVLQENAGMAVPSESTTDSFHILCSSVK
jgi:hypothetical protein